MKVGKDIVASPLWVGFEGKSLPGGLSRRLAAGEVSGVVLYSRNVESPAQVRALCREVRSAAGKENPVPLVAVDQEGGRVARFSKPPFTWFPPARAASLYCCRDEMVAAAVGVATAAELRAVGVDVDFAPVLDVGSNPGNTVIGDRAFHTDPRVVGELGRAVLQGFRQAGMSGVGKHFPGHGHVAADSHHEVPVDERTYEAIEAADLVPFRRLIEAGLGGIMPAHVIYPRVDSRPAGFSAVWLKQVLRGQLGFDGVIFSDDLSMEGASVAGGVVDRARAALGAGCDMVLLCNSPEAVDGLLDDLGYAMPAVSLARLARMHGRPLPGGMARLGGDDRYARAVQAVAAIGKREGELPLA